MKNNLLLCVLLNCLFLGAQPVIKIDASKQGAKISKDLYGIFFEDINHAGDGGMYPELIRNRGFETNRIPEDMERHGDMIHSKQGWRHRYVQPDSLDGWSIYLKDGAEGFIKQVAEKPLNNNNPMSMQIGVKNIAKGEMGIVNAGFWGISVINGENYLLSLYARADQVFSGNITVKLVSENGEEIARQDIQGIGKEWKQFKYTLKAAKTDPKAKFVIIPGSAGNLWVDMVSLFPEKTYKNRPNGMRYDIAKKIEDFKPGFIRFPGGCIVEGADLENRIIWKNTIGDVANRPGHWLLWDYYSTDGMGFHEYLQFCEDLGSPAMYVIAVGMSCQFRRCEYVTPDHLQPYIDEVMDALEYAMGPVTSKWGAERAKNGHPEPFKIKYVEIGNENYGRIYQEHYNIFYKAIKAKYPDLITIACTDPGMRDDFKREDLSVITEPIEIIDEHFYESTDFFYRNAYRYDDYDRSGPKIYCGEYAVKKWNNSLLGNLDAALAEAAFMTGFERNADIVVLSSQAPTLVNVNDRTWNPDLIGYNSSKSYGTPSYHMQKLFSNNIPDYVLKTEVEKSGYKINPPEKGQGMIGLFNIASLCRYKEIKVKLGDKIYSTEELFIQEDLNKRENGEWKVDLFQYLELNMRPEVKKYAEDNNGWADYTLSLKAIADDITDLEVFGINFYTLGKEKHYTWNIGRWLRWYWLQWYDDGYESYFGQKAGTIDMGKWYDISIRVKGDSIICHLNGELIHAVKAPDRATPGIYATSGINENGNIILKVVNPADNDQEIPVEIKGASGNYTKAGVEWISGERYTENSVEFPDNIKPKSKEVNIPGNSFKYLFPARSTTVLTLKK